MLWLEERGYEVKSFDAAKWQSEGRMHDDLKTQLGFPDYYGANLDALNDCLSDLEFAKTGGRVFVLWSSVSSCGISAGVFSATASNKAFEKVSRDRPCFRRKF